ncbi:MAG: ArnT family glycosyltransferase [Patescibacteria group bacterium]
MRRWLVAGIIFLAFLLRIVALDKFPVGFTADEASFGYDAYSLLKTGKDQWGHTWPLVLESGGDFKPPLYSYLAIPSIYLFGLTKVAVRLPNALVGTAAVYVTYLLVSELARDRFTKKNRHRSLASVAALLLAISPWHIMMSRGAFEANLTTLFLPLGILLFLKGLKNSRYFPWAALVFGLNLFSYHSAKLITPLILGLLVAMFYQQIRKPWLKVVDECFPENPAMRDKRSANSFAVKLAEKIPRASPVELHRELKKSYQSTHFVSILILGVFLILTAYTFAVGAGTRLADVSIFEGALEASSQERLTAIEAGIPEPLARLIHNKYQIFSRRLISNYLSYYSPNFLFSNGPAESSYGMIPGRGVLSWFELPFLLAAIVYFIRSKASRRWVFLLAWIFIAPIPASLATGPGYAANRAVIIIPAVQVFLALGAIQLWSFVKEKFPSRFIKGLFVLYILISAAFFVGFLEDYFIQSPQKVAKGMVYGSLEVAEWFVDNHLLDSEITISRTLSSPHIYFAFASKYDPQIYQRYTENWNYKDEGVNWVDQMSLWKLGNVTFGDINYEKHSGNRIFLAGRPEEFPAYIIPVEEIKYPNGDTAFIIVDASEDAYASLTK